jgi:hypothetical protein
VEKILDYLNVVKTAKKYITIKKLEEYSDGNKKTFGIIFVDLLIAVAVIVALYCICFVNKNYDLKVTGIILVVAFIIFYLIKISVFVISYGKKEAGIRTLMLIDGEGSYSTEWEMEGRKSLLIGKNTKNSQVDVDLSTAEYAALISKEHAVLNFASNNWYIEDIGSCNGVGVKKMNEISKIKLPKDTPCKLDSGDIIYIANTKLFIK